MAAGLLVDKIIGYFAMGREPHIRFTQYVLNHSSVKVLSLSRSFCINLTSSRFGASTLQISIAKEVEIPRFALTYARIAVTQTKGRTEKLG
jgi:hypothetical protein